VIVSTYAEYGLGFEVGTDWCHVCKEAYTPRDGVLLRNQGIFICAACIKELEKIADDLTDGEAEA